jgi:hypothetical protein
VNKGNTAMISLSHFLINLMLVYFACLTREKGIPGDPGFDGSCMKCIIYDMLTTLHYNLANASIENIHDFKYQTSK